LVPIIEPASNPEKDANVRTLQNTIQNPGSPTPNAHRALLPVLLAIGVFAAFMPAVTMAENDPAAPPDNSYEAVAGCDASLVESHPSAPCLQREPLIVIGFMGGHIHAGNLLHGEARLARDLDRRYPNAVDAMTFANRDEHDALRTVLQLLDTTKDGRLSQSEKSAARIVIFGHSWGASETVHFAKELDRRGIPVLLTVQVDSVEKSGEDDGTIPPNVREAINFYQTEGLLHGRRSIQAVDPKRTTILGSYQSTYKTNPVSCVGYGWFARAFMRPHIEIENDDAVWHRIEALIVARSCAPNVAGLVASCMAK
jgi:pimeloyl-ACP methyl ester carboxylesterase